MPHYLSTQRAEIDALIGPTEELIGKAHEIVLAIGHPPEIASVLAGLGRALTDLERTVREIDEFQEEPKAKPEEAEDEDEDEDTEEDEDA